jgi:hypothetical protein
MRANSEWRMANRKSGEQPFAVRTSLFVDALGILAFAIYLFFADAIDAHDSWISRGGHRNAAGEWCCGEGDCFVLPARQVSARADGYHIWFIEPFDGADRVRAEIVPYGEAQLSPDGAYWHCKRSDGSRRCFFAPPANS